VNGNGEEEWEFTHQSVTHVLPPYGWLAIGSDEFYESSELLDGKRCDRVSSREYVFVDGRGSFLTFDGIGTSGSIAVRRGRNGSGLSIIAIEGVEGISISLPTRPFGPEGVRTEISRVAKARRISVRAFDQNGKALGPVPASKTQAGWKIQPRDGALRYEIRIE